MASSVSPAVCGSSRIGPQLVLETGILEQPAGGSDMIFRNQQPPRQDTERSLQHAHVLIEHDVGNSSSIKQRFDGRDQHSIIGPNEFAHTCPSMLPPTTFR